MARRKKNGACERESWLQAAASATAGSAQAYDRSVGRCSMPLETHVAPVGETSPTLALGPEIPRATVLDLYSKLSASPLSEGASAPPWRRRRKKRHEVHRENCAGIVSFHVLY